LGGRTNVANLQVLCGPCNREKGSTDSWVREIPQELAVIPSDGKLRDWQARALDVVLDAHGPVLVEACPGAGKTRFAQEAAHRLYASGSVNRILVVVPTARLVTQWVESCSGFLDGSPKLPMAAAGWSPVRPIHNTELGAVFTYQALRANPLAFEALTVETGFRTLVILDEVHHAGRDASWGAALSSAFGRAERVLCLTGTAFRTDDEITFVEYDGDGRAIADFSYPYGDAVVDGACRPVEFHVLGGETEFATPDGIEHAVGFDDDLTDRGASYRLRTALDFADGEGGWIYAALSYSATELDRLRRSDPDAGGLVVAMDIEHAYEIAKALTAITGREPYVAVSRLENEDDLHPQKAIAAYEEGRSEWIVAVKMISEGVDIRRLRVLTYATNVTAELAFRQMIGRVVRSDSANDPDYGVVVLPADPTLRRRAEAIAEEAESVVTKAVVISGTRGRVEVHGIANESGEFRPLSSQGRFDHILESRDSSDSALGRAVHTYLTNNDSPITAAQLTQMARSDPDLRSRLLSLIETDQIDADS